MMECMADVIHGDMANRRRCGGGSARDRVQCFTACKGKGERTGARLGGCHDEQFTVIDNPTRGEHDVKVTRCIGGVIALVACLWGWVIASASRSPHMSVDQVCHALSWHELQGGMIPEAVGHPGRSRRLRTRRLNVTSPFQEQEVVFIPEETPHADLERRLAMHYGYAPAWVHPTWHTPHAVTLSRSSEFPILNVQTKDQLWELTDSMAPTQTQRRLWGAKDIYFGHRASRAHGLTVATAAHASTVGRVNHFLRAMMPSARWNAFGVVEHGNIPCHTDTLASETSYVFSLTAGTGVLRFTSPLNGEMRRAAARQNAIAFDPRLPHSFSTDRRTRSLTLYTTGRRPTQANKCRLAQLQFPV